jgi:hypothetical protein
MPVFGHHHVVEPLTGLTLDAVDFGGETNNSRNKTICLYGKGTRLRIYR